MGHVDNFRNVWRFLSPRPVPHDEVGVEPQRGVDDQLPPEGAHGRRQPAGLAGVHQEEHDVVAGKGDEFYLCKIDRHNNVERTCR